MGMRCWWCTNGHRTEYYVLLVPSCSSSLEHLAWLSIVENDNEVSHLANTWGVAFLSGYGIDRIYSKHALRLLVVVSSYEEK